MDYKSKLEKIIDKLSEKISKYRDIISNISYAIPLVALTFAAGCSQKTKLPEYMTQLTAMKHNEFYPKWSPVNDPSNKSYDLIAFKHPSGLYIRPASGGAPEKLVAGKVEDICWSPDGTKICYTINRKGIATDVSYNEIYVVDLETKKSIQLTKKLNGIPIGWKDNNTILFFSSSATYPYPLYELRADLDTPIASLEQALKSNEMRELLNENKDVWEGRLLISKNDELYLNGERLTNDEYCDINPSGAPHGGKFVFSSVGRHKKTGLDLYIFDYTKYEQEKKNLKFKNYSEGRK